MVPLGQGRQGNGQASGQTPRGIQEEVGCICIRPKIPRYSQPDWSFGSASPDLSWPSLPHGGGMGGREFSSSFLGSTPGGTESTCSGSRKTSVRLWTWHGDWPNPQDAVYTLQPSYEQKMSASSQELHTLELVVPLLGERRSLMLRKEEVCPREREAHYLAHVKGRGLSRVGQIFT